MHSSDSGKVTALAITVLALTILSVASFAMAFITLDLSYLGRHSLSGFDVLTETDGGGGILLSIVFYAGIVATVFALFGLVWPNALKGTALCSLAGIICMLIVWWTLICEVGFEFLDFGVYLCGIAHLLSVILSVSTINAAEDAALKEAVLKSSSVAPAKVEKKAEPMEKQPTTHMVLPVTNYYPNHLFRVVNCIVQRESSAGMFKLQLAVFTSVPPRALQLQLQWITLWGEKISTDAFTSFELNVAGKYYETEWMPITIPTVKIKELVAVNHTIHRIMFSDYAVNVVQKPVDVEVPLEKLAVLRKSTLEYAVCEYSKNEISWQCICGKTHPNSVDKCDVCHYKHDSGELLAKDTATRKR